MCVGVTLKNYRKYNKHFAKKTTTLLTPSVTLEMRPCPTFLLSISSLSRPLHCAAGQAKIHNYMAVIIMRVGAKFK